MMIAGVMLCLSILSVPADAWWDGLLPRPRGVEARDGRFALDRGAVCHLVVPADTAPDRLRARFSETLAELSLESHMTVSMEGKVFALQFGEPETCAMDVTDLSAEGYLLEVTDAGIALASPSERGLFYGIMSLRQIVEIAREKGFDGIPGVHLRDWPAIGLRGPHEDFGRDQLPTMDDLKRSIRTAATFKMNTYLWFIEPDHFVYDFDPDISTDYDRFRFDEIRELVAYAHEYYVDIVPVVELLAHMEMLLRHERYRELSESGQGGDTLCPTSDASFELVRKMVDEIAPAFDSVYFHSGLDESVAVGQGRSMEAVHEHGLEHVYADYYTRVNDLVRSHGKTMVMYADIVLNHPAILDLLPRNITMMFWNYYPAEHYDGLDTLVRTGFPVMALSGLWDWSDLYPLYVPGFENMDVMAAQAAEAGVLGYFASSWGDAYCSAGGANLSEWNAYGFLYLGAISWNTRPIPIEEYSAVFARRFFGTQDPGLAEALTRLARCQGDDLSHHMEARRAFHESLMQTRESVMSADDSALAYWEGLRSEARAAHRLLSEAQVTRNADHKRAIGLAARMLCCASDMALVCRAISTEEPAVVVSQLRAIEAEHRALWREYQEVWSATNRPLNLVHIGRSWTAASDSIAQMVVAVENGVSLP